MIGWDEKLGMLKTCTSKYLPTHFLVYKLSLGGYKNSFDVLVITDKMNISQIVSEFFLHLAGLSKKGHVKALQHAPNNLSKRVKVNTPAMAWKCRLSCDTKVPFNQKCFVVSKSFGKLLIKWLFLELWHIWYEDNHSTYNLNIYVDSWNYDFILIYLSIYYCIISFWYIWRLCCPEHFNQRSIKKRSY